MAANTIFAAGFVLLLMVCLLFWLSTLLECLTKESSQGNDKLVWTLVIIFLNVFGAILYRVARRPQRLRELHN